MRMMIIFLTSLLAMLLACGEARSVPRPAAPRIEQIASPAEGIFANAYLIETADGVVVVDALLRVSDATALRARIAALGKPLIAVLLTHGHPDHYNGAAIVTAGGNVPVIAAREVDRMIRDDDAAKEKQWKPMFGDEWPAPRAFPTRLVGDGEVVPLGGLGFRVHVMGPAESHADSYWTIDGLPVAFIGDLVFSGTHSYISDGHTTAWLAALERLAAALPAEVTLYPGHGKAGGVELPEGALAAGDIDLAVGTILAPPAAMRVTTLYRESFAVIVRRGHPCLAAPLTPAAYAALAHILIAAPGDGPGLVDRALEEHGLRRNVVLRTPHFLTVAPFVAASDLISTVPSRIARAISDSLGIVVLDPPLPIQGFDVQMFWHPRRERDPAVQWLREQLRAVAATLAEPPGLP